MTTRAKTRLVCGWGINDSDDEMSYINEAGVRVATLTYNVWRNIIRKTRGDKPGDVCAEWRYFATFERWMLKQREFEGLTLAVMLPNTQDYTPETSAFVSRRLDLHLISLSKDDDAAGILKDRWGYRAYFFPMHGPAYYSRQPSRAEARVDYLQARARDLETECGLHSNPIVTRGLRAHVEVLKRRAEAII